MMSILKKITRDRIEIWINNVLVLVLYTLAYTALTMIIVAALVVICQAQPM